MTTAATVPLACPYCTGTRFLVVERVHSDELWARLKSPGFAVRAKIEVEFDLRSCLGCGHVALFAREPQALRDERFAVTEVRAAPGGRPPFR